MHCSRNRGAILACQTLLCGLACWHWFDACDRDVGVSIILSIGFILPWRVGTHTTHSSWLAFETCCRGEKGAFDFILCGKLPAAGGCWHVCKYSAGGSIRESGDLHSKRNRDWEAKPSPMHPGASSGSGPNLPAEGPSNRVTYQLPVCL